MLTATRQMKGTEAENTAVTLSNPHTFQTTITGRVLTTSRTMNYFIFSNIEWSLSYPYLTARLNISLYRVRDLKIHK